MCPQAHFIKTYRLRTLKELKGGVHRNKILNKHFVFQDKVHLNNDRLC